MRWPTIAFAVAAAVLLLSVRIVPWLEFVYILALAKGFAALGVAILLRAGLISLGHALFFAFGAYVVAFLGRERIVGDVVALLVIATIASAALGAIVGPGFAPGRFQRPGGRQVEHRLAVFGGGGASCQQGSAGDQAR